MKFYLQNFCILLFSFILKLVVECQEITIFEKIGLI